MHFSIEGDELAVLSATDVKDGMDVIFDARKKLLLAVCFRIAIVERHDDMYFYVTNTLCR